MENVRILAVFVSCHSLKLGLFHRSKTNKCLFTPCSFFLHKVRSTKFFHIFVSYLSCYNKKFQCVLTCLVFFS